MEYALTTNDLCKRYGKFSALNGLTIKIPKGAIYGLIGKNGAGKTTLIRLICGLQHPTGGEFSLFGISGDSSDFETARRRMGAVVEIPAICPNMTATENLKTQCDILGISYENVPQLLELVGLSDTGKKKAGKFSLGMRQRLGIAVALCGQPDLLILDEPTNGLDPQGIVDIRNLILKLNQEQGITFLVSSHILDELSKIATHYGFVSEGVLVKELTSSEFERSRRKAVFITTDGNGDLPHVLKSLSLEHEILDKSHGIIYGKHKITPLILTLHEHGICVHSLTEQKEDLEQFYFSVLGGEKHG